MVEYDAVQYVSYKITSIIGVVLIKVIITHKLYGETY